MKIEIHKYKDSHQKARDIARKLFKSGALKKLTNRQEYFVYEIQDISADLKKAKEALKFYADSYNYGDGNGLGIESTKIVVDRGLLARQTLKDIE